MLRRFMCTIVLASTSARLAVPDTLRDVLLVVVLAGALPADGLHLARELGEVHHFAPQCGLPPGAAALAAMA